MSCLTSNTHVYRGISEVSFFLNDNEKLSVTIDTERLHIRSVESSESDYNAYGALFGDSIVMAKYGDGSTRKKEEIQNRIDTLWVKRWREKDPYSGLAVFKKDSDDFLGHVVLGHGDKAGQSELAYLFMHNHWKKGYGTEAVTAVVQEYAPATVKEGYSLEGKPLEVITATARPDNPGSVKILEKIGMTLDRKEEKFGTLRHHYFLKIVTSHKVEA